MVCKRKNYLSSIFSVLFLCGAAAGFLLLPAQAMAGKAAVAIQEISIGEEVSSNSLKHFNQSALLAEMEASIRKSRRFDLLTRQEKALSAIRKEQKFAGSELTNSNGAAEQGNLRIANFLIMPEVQNFTFYRSNKEIPNIGGKYKQYDYGMLEMQIQILDTKTGEIKSAFYCKAKTSTKSVIVSKKSYTPNKSLFTTMTKKVAAQMTDQLIDTVFPMIVLKVQDSKVWISRGGDGGLKVGQVLEVFSKEEELFDPYTNESLGSAEELVGKVKITRVKPKVTEARVISQSAPIDRGSILRKIN